MAKNLPLPYYPTAADARILEADIIEYGNIDLLLRVAKRTKKDPQAIQTLVPYTFQRKFLVSFTASNKPVYRNFQVAAPTIDPDGNKLTDKAAENLYYQTEAHLGIFANKKVAEQYLRKLSQANGFVQKTIIPANQETVENSIGLSTFSYLTTPFDIYKTNTIPKEILTKLNRNVNRLGELISIPGIPALSEAGKTIASNLTSISVDYKMAETTEVTVSLVDPNYSMMENNYFVPRRVIQYRGREFEIAVVDVSAQDSVPSIELQLRSRAVQRMKRDKTPKNFAAANGYELAKKLAFQYGLRFLGEPNPAKVQTVAKFNSKDVDESAWNVLTRTAGDGQSVCFEMDGTLIYASERYLMGVLGIIRGEDFGVITASGTNKKYVPLAYLPKHWLADPYYGNSDIVDVMDEFPLIQWPEFRTSDNDPLEASGSCRVARPNGCLLRPGHTALVGPLPTFFAGYYLIDAVSFRECTNEPVEVSFKTPEKPKDQKKPSTGIRPGKKSFASFAIKPASTNS